MQADPIPLATRAHELRALLIPFVSRRVDPQDVDDVLQSVFVRIQRGLGTLREGDKLVAWGYQIARNVIVDHMRRRSVRKLEPLDTVRTAATVDDVDSSGATELAAILGHFIAMLPEPYREAIQLTEIDGLTQADAARQVGLSLPGMKSRVQRGRAQLRELLEDCCAIERDTRGGIIDVEPTNPPAGLPNCCGLHPSEPPRVSRGMSNTSHESMNEVSGTSSSEEKASSCCGGPAPAGANACCVKDAAAKAAGESGCGCNSKPASSTKRGCC